MLTILQEISTYLHNVIEFLGYWGIGIGMFFESACIPIPSELILPLAGMMVDNGRLTMLNANIVVNIGSMLGSIAAYAVGFFGGRPFILKYGSSFFISQKHFNTAEKTFTKYGSAAVMFGRMLPIIRTFISLPAGISKMNMKKFIIYSIIGMVPWNFTLIYLGFKFNSKYEKLVSPIFHKLDYIVISAVVLAIIFIGVKVVLNKKRGK